MSKKYDEIFLAVVGITPQIIQSQQQTKTKTPRIMPHTSSFHNKKNTPRVYNLLHGVAYKNTSIKFIITLY